MEFRQYIVYNGPQGVNLCNFYFVRKVSFSIQHKALLSAQRREFEARNSSGGSMDSPLLLKQGMTTDPSKQVKLGSINVLVPRAKSIEFERILFRASRGNLFLKQSMVENSFVDPVTREKVEKNVFVVFFSGERAKNKILKICEALGAYRYPCTDDLSNQFQMITEVF